MQGKWRDGRDDVVVDRGGPWWDRGNDRPDGEDGEDGDDGGGWWDAHGDDSGVGGGGGGGNFGWIRLPSHSGGASGRAADDADYDDDDEEDDESYIDDPILRCGRRQAFIALRICFSAAPPDRVRHCTAGTGASRPRAARCTPRRRPTWSA